MFDIRKWFQKETSIDFAVLQSMGREELFKLAKENKIDIDDKAEKPVIVEAIKKFVEAKKTEQGGENTKSFKYLCIADCVYLGKYRRVGDIITLTEKKEVPHFSYVEFGVREDEKN